MATEILAIQFIKPRWSSVVGL